MISWRKMRRWLFQIHLWMGIGLGLYVLVISVSGSAVVLRPQISQWFLHSRVASTEGVPLSGPALEARVAEVYRGFRVVDLVPPFRPGRALYVVLEQDGKEVTRYFDHYAGRDLGETFPWQVRAVEWLVALHDELLLGRPGKTVNGVGGALFLLMVATGLVLWWPGRGRWKQALVVSRASPRSLLWQLHGFLGLWTFLLMFAWGITAVYFAFPAPFDFIIDFFDADLDDGDRPDGFLLFLIDLHFGRFGGLWGRSLWMALGLLPAAMFITGFILWWRRVVRKRGKPGVNVGLGRPRQEDWCNTRADSR